MSEFFAQYKHPSWQKRRLEIMQRDEFACQVCYDNESQLNVHHKHYIKGRKVWEYEDKELVTLCESCHETYHGEQAEFKQVLASLPLDGPFCVGGAMSMMAGWATGAGVDPGRFAELRPMDYAMGRIAAILEIETAYGPVVHELRHALETSTRDKFDAALVKFIAELRAD